MGLWMLFGRLMHFIDTYNNRHYIQINQILMQPTQTEQTQLKNVQLIKKKNGLFGSFSTASDKHNVGGRKCYNIVKMRQYMEKREKSMRKREQICKLLESKFIQKQKYTLNFIQCLNRYFSQMMQNYIQIQKGFKNLQINKKYKQLCYIGIRNAIEQNIKVNENIGQKMHTFIQWIQQQILTNLHCLSSSYQHKMSKINKQILSINKQLTNTQLKQIKIYQKLSQANDLLQKQLLLLQQIKITNQISIIKSVTIYEGWETIVSLQHQLKRSINHIIQEFMHRNIQYLQKSQGIYKLIATNQMPEIYQIFYSILSPQHLQYISYNAKEKQNLSTKIQNFLRMKHQQHRIGNPFTYMDMLITKSMKAKLKIGKQQWKNIRLLFSIDDNLLVYDESNKTFDHKLIQKQLKICQLSPNILQITGKSEGLLFNSSKKIYIRFETADEMSQMAYFVNELIDK